MDVSSDLLFLVDRLSEILLLKELLIIVVLPLDECKGMRNGAVIYFVTNAVSFKVQRSGTGLIIKSKFRYLQCLLARTVLAKRHCK